MSSTEVEPRKGFLMAAIACFVTALLLLLGPLWWWAIMGMNAHIGTGWFWTDLILVPGLCSVGGWLVNEA